MGTRGKHVPALLLAAMANLTINGPGERYRYRGSAGPTAPRDPGRKWTPEQQQEYHAEVQRLKLQHPDWNRAKRQKTARRLVNELT